MRARPKVLFVVNVDTFFVSHRLRLGMGLRDAGFEVVVAAGETKVGAGLTLGGDAARTVIEREGMRFVPIPVERGGKSLFREGKLLAALAALYRKEAPDVVHHVSIKPVLYGTMVARALRLPHVINAISGLGFVFTERAADPLKTRALRLAVRTAYFAALRDRNLRFLFQNPDDRAAFLDMGLVQEANSTLIRGSGVDTQVFSFVPLPTTHPPRVVVPARLLWDKGIGEVIEAAKILKARNVAATIELVGPLDAENPATIARATVDGWVRAGLVEWTGGRPKPEMPEVFAKSHLVVLPSYREGLPLSLAEAAATGRACITADAPGCREIVADGVTGWLVPPRDGQALAAAIEAALGDRAELEKRGVAGRERVVAGYSIERVVADTLAVYRGLLGDRFPAP